MSKHWVSLVLALEVIIANGFQTSGHAATFTVINTNDSGAGSLGKAIASSNAPSLIETTQAVAPGAVEALSPLPEGQEPNSFLGEARIVAPDPAPLSIKTWDDLAKPFEASGFAGTDRLVMQLQSGRFPVEAGLGAGFKARLAAAVPGLPASCFAFVVCGAPLQQGLEADLRQRGAEVLGLCPPNTYIVRSDLPSLVNLTASKWVYAAVEPSLEHKLHPQLQAGATGLTSPDEEVEVAVSLYVEDAAGTVRKELGALGLHIREYFPSIKCFAGKCQRGVIEALAGHAQVLFVEPSLPVATSLNKSVGLVNATRVRSHPYHFGANVIVGIIDTGFRTDHFAFAGQSGYPNLYRDGWNLSGEGDASATWTDPDGHGSHVLGIMLSRWAGHSPRLDGVAPWLAGDANHYLRAVRVGKSDGTLVHVDSAISTLAAENSSLVINNSWGDTNNSGNTRLSRLADDAAWNNNQLWIFAAGNSGPGAGSIGSPGAAKNVLAVGSVHDDGTLARSTFSSMGPTRDLRYKPEIYAPGGSVQSVDARSSDGSTRKSGTSMAAPHVTAVAASVMDHYPSLQRHPAALKAYLIASARRLSTLPDTQAGIVDSYRSHWRTSDTHSLSGSYDGDIPQGGTRSWDFTVESGYDKMYAVLCWTEPAPSPAAAFCVNNDIDLTVDFGADGTVEWSSQSIHDNFEFAEINNPQAGPYRFSAYGKTVSGSSRLGLGVMLYKNSACAPVVSGTIRSSGGLGVLGITVALSNGGGAATTDANGNYSRQVPCGWSGSVIPSHPAYYFYGSYPFLGPLQGDEVATDFTGRLVNDYCNYAIPLASGVTLTMNTFEATAAGDPTPECGSGVTRGVWFKFLVPHDGLFRVSTCGSDFDTVLQVYTGGCGSLAKAVCNDDSGPACAGQAASVEFAGTGGATYYLLAGGKGGSSGNLRITASAPANDLCSGAIALVSGVPNSINTGNAGSAQDPTPYCGSGVTKGVWFSYRPPGDGQVMLKTCDSDFDTVLQVYSGNCGYLIPVICNDDDGPACPGPQASVQFNTSPGTDYYILAGGKNGSSGNLSIMAGFVPANDTCSAAVPLADAYTLNLTSVGATSTGDPVPTCNVNASNGIWFSYTPALSGPVLVSTCGSDFDTVVQVYSGACGSFTAVACNDDNGPLCAGAQASVFFNGKGGTNYYILVAGKNGTTGKVAITLHAPSNIALDGFDPDVRAVGGNTNGLILATAVQPDAKILIGGVFALVGGLPRTNLARLNPDGSLDLSFTASVLSELHLPGSVTALAVQRDGKILVAGDFTRAAGKARSNLARLNTDGTVDGSFTPAADGPIRALALQTDDMILVGGSFTNLAGQLRTNIARLNPNGTLDAAFNPGAYFEGSSPSQVGAVTVQPDGKILFGGNFTKAGGQSRTNLARLNRDGTLEEEFSPAADGAVRVLALQVSGMILVGGDFATIGGQPRTHIARLDPDGNPDPGFNPGVAGGAQPVATLSVQADGKILLGGDFVQVGGQWRTNLARLTPSGALDDGFNPTALGPLYSLALQSDGKILVGGDLYALGGFARNGIGRLYPNGSADATIGNQAGFTGQTVESIAVQPDGKILVGGWFDGHILRFTPDGFSDLNFPGYADYNVKCLAVQPDGKILVGGDFNNLDGQPRAGVGRLNADGTLDGAFVPGASVSETKCIVIQPDQKILVGGYFGFSRLNSDGSVDSTFVPGGSPTVGAIALQPDGKILVAGTFSELGGLPRTNIARLNPNGTADPGFNPGANTWINVLAVQPDGKILVGGDQLSYLAGHSCTFLARLNADGSFDTSFNGSAAGGNYPQVFSLAVQADGRILVGGDFTTLGGLARTNLGRLYPDGTLDEAFDGQLGEWTQVRGIAVQPDGDVLVGGNFESLAGAACSSFSRLNSGGAAFQSLGLMSNYTAVSWSRSGCGPEIDSVTFEVSTNGTNYAALGKGTRQGGTWQLGGLVLPVGQDLYVRARGRAAGAIYNGSSGLIESVQNVFLPGPVILTQPAGTAAPYGSGVTFLVSAAGAQPLRYQWFHGGVFIPDATQSSLQVVANDSTAGDYNVVVSTPYASLTSLEATLTVRAPIFQFASSAPLTIPSVGPASTYPATILVSNAPGTVSRVSVTLSNLAHTYPEDFDVLLVGPAGQNVLLASDAGGYSHITNVTITLDDFANANLPELDAILPGTHRPTDYPPADTFDAPAPGGPYGTSLSTFVQTDPNGTWSLFIMDDQDGDSGLVAGGWSLQITTLLSTAPAALHATAGPGGLELGWPPTQFGWRLEMQTNSPGSGLGTNWVTVAGSTVTNRVTVPLMPQYSSAFFRLVFP